MYSVIGEYDKAIADYSKTIEISPTYALAYNNRGFVFETPEKNRTSNCGLLESNRNKPEILRSICQSCLLPVIFRNSLHRKRKSKPARKK